MLERYGESAYENGFTVYTTISSKLQKSATAAIKEGLLAYDKRHGYRGVGPDRKRGTPVKFIYD